MTTPLRSRAHTFWQVEGRSNTSTATTCGPTATARPLAPSTYFNRSRNSLRRSWWLSYVSAIAPVPDEAPRAPIWRLTSVQTAPWSEACPCPSLSDRDTDSLRCLRSFDDECDPPEAKCLVR